MTARTSQGGRRQIPLASWILGVLALPAVPLVVAIDPGAEPVLGVTVPSPAEPTWWMGLGLITAQALTLRRRHAHPTLVLLGTALAIPLGGLLRLGDAIGALSVAVILAAFTCGSQAVSRRQVPALVAAITLAAVGTAAAGQPLGSSVVQGLGIVLAPSVIAAWIRGRQDLASARREQQRARAGETEARIQSALDRERTDMARELHDIAAHHLSGMAVMTAAISTQIDTDPPAAKRAVQQVRDQCTDLLTDLRSLVGLLRETGAEPAALHTSPRGPESLAGIPQLVAGARATGAQVTLRVLPGTGELGRGIGPLAQLSGYRMVQESLANAALHAPGAACTVLVDDSAPTHLQVEVRNDPPSSPPRPGRTGGLGLVGMRERAELTSSRLHHGETSAGGWEVVLTISRQGRDRVAAP